MIRSRMTFGILLVGNGNGVQGLGAGVLSVRRKRHGTFLRMNVCQLVDLQEHTSSFLINIRALLIFFFLPVYILQGWPDS